MVSSVCSLRNAGAQIAALLPLSGRRMGMAQIAAPIASADEIDGGGRLLQFHLERGHERILSGHGHAVADAVNMEPNGKFIVGHLGFFLAVPGGGHAGKPITVLTAECCQVDAAVVG
jgi:hypothetical protein